jgi:parvulin-like peptidyl-prolyl isomerase
LSQAGLTLKELKQQISDQIIQARLMAVVGAKVMVPDAEVRKVYEETGKESGVQLHLRIIRLPYPAGATDAVKEEIKQKAEAVLKEAQQGTPFREIGAKLSVTEADLGFVALSDINPNLAERLTSMKPKEFAPIQTPEGFQVIQLAERRSGQSRSFEEAAPEIRNVLMQKEMEKQYEEWVKGLRAKAHIKMML